MPSAWKQANILKILKSGDREKAENYRPISVLPMLSRLLEKAVHDQLLTFFESNKLLNDSQYTRFIIQSLQTKHVFTRNFSRDSILLISI